MTDYSIAIDSNLQAFPYELTSLRDEVGELTLEMTGADASKTIIRFIDHIYFNKYDEGDAIKTLQYLDSAGVLGRSVLLRVWRSSILNEFLDEGCHTRMEVDLSHYMIISINDIVNVISLGAPIVYRKS